MLRRAALLVAVVLLGLGIASDVTSPTKVSPFCSNGLHGVTCIFVNITQDVVVGGGSFAAAAGIASQHPVKISCPATLNVTNSSLNITAGKAATATSGPSHVSQPSLDATEASMTTAPHTPVVDSGSPGVTSSLLDVAAASGPSHASQPSPNTTEINATDTPAPFVGSETTKLRNILGALQEPPRECVVNVSVKDSTLLRVRGHFDTAQFQDSIIVNLGGVYSGYLSVKSSEVSNVSLSGRRVEVRDTKIALISRLKAERHLVMRRVEVGRVARDGLLLLPSDGDKSQRPHNLNHVVVRRLEADSLVAVAGAKVHITNVIVDSLGKDAVAVRSKGLMFMCDVVLLGCDSFYCLSLERGARLILRNVTIRNRTITRMDLQATSAGNTYPLLALFSKDDSPSLQVTFPWYWVIIMAVCGVVAGTVIGSAIMWKRRTLRVVPASTLTLADLLSHDRMNESNTRDHLTDHATDLSRRPTLARQDSGLTSSSFASYLPYQTPKTDTRVDMSTNLCDAARDDV